MFFSGFFPDKNVVISYQCHILVTPTTHYSVRSRDVYSSSLEIPIVD